MGAINTAIAVLIAKGFGSMFASLRSMNPNFKNK